MSATDNTSPDTIIYTMRLQRYLARSGVASRRGSEQLITDGRVAVNGTVVSELGTKVKIGVDRVTVDGRRILPAAAHSYLILNKPARYLTTMKDPYGRPCVADLIPVDDIPGIFPVGRLDQDTTGLLLCTTDGELAHGLLHPSRHVDKEYLALVAGVCTEKDLQRLGEGVCIECDGSSFWTAPAEARRVSATDLPQTCGFAEEARSNKGSSTLISLKLHEGKKHQVKLMCEAIGHPVIRLHRCSFGPLSLGDLPIGGWRYLESGEILSLTQSALHGPQYITSKPGKKGSS